MALPHDPQDAIDTVRDSKEGLFWDLICQWAERRQKRAMQDLATAKVIDEVWRLQGKLEVWDEVLRLPENIVAELKQQKETSSNA